MGWTNPRTWVASEIVTASLLNTHVRDNLSYLFSGRGITQTIYTSTSTYSTTSTSFVDVDATNIKTTATIKSGKALVIASFQAYSGSGGGHLDIYSVELAARCGHATYGLALIEASTARHVTLIGYFSGLPDGSNTFKLQYRARGGGDSINVGVSSVAFTDIYVMTAVEIG